MRTRALPRVGMCIMLALALCTTAEASIEIRADSGGPKFPPPPPPPPPGGRRSNLTTVLPDVGWGEYRGVHGMGVESVIAFQDEPPPDLPPWNKPPKKSLFPDGTGLETLVVPVKILVYGTRLDDMGELMFGPLADGTTVETAELVTETGLRVDMRVTLLDDLHNDLPASVNLQGFDVVFDWSVNEFIDEADFAGRYYLLEAEVAFTDLYRVPAPGALFILPIGLAGLAARRRRAAGRSPLPA